MFLSITSKWGTSKSGHLPKLALPVLLAGCAVFAPLPPAAAQAAAPIGIDASQPWTAPQPAAYDEDAAVSPSGARIGLNSRFLTLDGKPWVPVMGEFHFSRYPRTGWEDQILKMKASGVNIVSTYVIWIHHEEVKGQFDWEGQRDLRAFAQLCAKHGMYMVVRIGPWVHGEVRNGGLPDWVLKQGPTRINDPVYLGSVRAWYGQIGLQLSGLMWQQGGPVIGVQLENEYSKRGPDAGEAHILELKSIARASGMRVPLYFVTGWNKAAMPARAVLPVSGGYPAAPWDSTITKLPPEDVYNFFFKCPARTLGDGLNASAKCEQAQSVPSLTAEIGGGNQDTYHRRPVIAPDDIAALFPVMLGSGVNLYGTYMFQGGENPDGQLSTLQESQETGYTNDLPIKSYDFQAPLGEFGQEQLSLRKLKVFQYFLNDFGSDLAPMTVHAPDRLPHNEADFSVPRTAVRSRGDTGFIFFNNYVRGYQMPARRAVQFSVHLPGATLLVPRHPVDLPSGSYFIWPFNLRVNGLTLRYSTAQLFTRIEGADSTTLYFEALPGIAPEFAFDAAGLRSLHLASGETSRNAGVLYIGGIQPDLNAGIDLASSQGKHLRVVVLTAQQAMDAWKVKIDGAEHLLITSADVVADPDATDGTIQLLSRGTSQFSFAITPSPALQLKTSLPVTVTADGQAAAYAATAPAHSVKLEFGQTRPAGEAAPVKFGPHPAWASHGVAEAPSAGPLPQAATWSLTIPAGSLDGLNDLYLSIDYQGDVARLSADHRLLADDFYNGRPWTIGLKRFLDERGAGSFELNILPLRKDAPVYFELAHPPDFAANGQVGKIESIRLIPEYRLVIDSGSH